MNAEHLCHKMSRPRGRHTVCALMAMSTSDVGFFMPPYDTVLEIIEVCVGTAPVVKCEFFIQCRAEIFPRWDGKCMMEIGVANHTGSVLKGFYG